MSWKSADPQEQFEMRVDEPLEDVAAMPMEATKKVLVDFDCQVEDVMRCQFFTTDLARK